MMMSRPEPKDSKVAPAPVVEKVAPPKTTHEAVEDLERRLAMLGEVKPVLEQTKQEDPPPPPPPPASSVPKEAKAQEVKGGKAALLVRSCSLM
jgi:hypothetical protein